MFKVMPARVWLFAFVFALVLSSPYLIGVLSAPKGWQFSGAAVVPSGFRVDFNSHLAKMWQGWRGQWDYQLLFTHEAHQGLPTVQGFYVALGVLARFMPFDFPVVYHITRFILSIGLILALWRFSGLFFSTMRERWFALWFSVLVGGWSWLLFFLNPEMTRQPEGFPIEFWLFDAFNLLGAFYMPHFSAAIILQIIAFMSLEKYVAGDNRALLWMSIALLADAIIQPYVVLLVIGVIGGFTLYHLFISQRLTMGRALWLFVPLGVHIGIVLFQYFSIARDPVWAQFTAQNITASPPILYYLLGYAPLLIPSVLGIRQFWREGGVNLPLLMSWIGVVCLLLYAPFPTQRRYLLGVQTPLAILATYGWVHTILPLLTLKRRSLLNISFFTFAGLSHILLLITNASALANPLQQQDIFYHPDELAGFAWVRENTEPSALILTTFDWTGEGSGGKVVAQTGRRVFLGHWIETIHFNDKIVQVRTFYQAGDNHQLREEFLESVGIDYIWYDNSARNLGELYAKEIDGLEVVFTSPTLIIYGVFNR